MGLEGWNKKPKDVREAALDGNKAALSAMGRKGAKVRQANRELEADIQEVQAARHTEIAQEEEQERIKSANEHIIDPDGNDLDYTD